MGSPKKLDRSRPFGEISGAGACRYEQDGMQFNIHGEEIIIVGAPPLKATPENGVKSRSGVVKSAPAK